MGDTMPLVTIAELKATLGIGDLYADAIVQQVADAASDVVLDMLIRYRATVDQVCCPVSVTPPGTGTTIRFRTTEPHVFQVGQVVILRATGIPGFDGRNLTITELEGDLIIVASSATPWDPGTFDPRPLIPNGTVLLKESEDYYAAIPEAKEAGLAIAVDIFQSRVAPGGQMEAVDFTPGPYRLGRSLISRVQGLLGRWLDPGSMVG